MKKALISPEEKCEFGVRVAQISEIEFEVCPPLFWVDCEDTITAEGYTYDESQGSFLEIIIPEYIPPETKQLSVVIP